jgi:hypothetical protein
MGIRYYAWPLHPDLIDLARSYPEAFAADDPFADAWFTENAGNCYLDKAWSGLQIVLGGSIGPASGRRPAFSLVEGDVTMTDLGWIAHFGVLDPIQLRRAARDLEQVLVAHVPPESKRDKARMSRRFLAPIAMGDRDYVVEHLEVLKGFVGPLAASGMGMVYMIG